LPGFCITPGVWLVTAKRLSRATAQIKRNWSQMETWGQTNKTDAPPSEEQLSKGRRRGCIS